MLAFCSDFWNEDKMDRQLPKGTMCLTPAWYIHQLFNLIGGVTIHLGAQVQGQGLELEEKHAIQDYTEVPGYWQNLPLTWGLRQTEAESVNVLKPLSSGQ